MTREIRIGDRVKLLGMPDWLMHDLPDSEQDEMRSFIGMNTVVDEIDAYGYFWVSFRNGMKVVHEEDREPALMCSGHSFAIEGDFLEVLAQES